MDTATWLYLAAGLCWTAAFVLFLVWVARWPASHIRIDTRQSTVVNADGTPMKLEDRRQVARTLRMARTDLPGDPTEEMR